MLVGSGRSGSRSDGVRARRGSGRRGWTGWRNQGEGRDGDGIGNELAGVEAGGGGRGRGRGGWGGTRGASSSGWKGRRGKGNAKAGTLVWREKPEHRDWARMPWDTLSLIFQKIGPAEVLCSAQAVCSHWWHLAHDPSVWRIVDFTNIDFIGHGYTFADLKRMSFEAVDRSAGLLQEFSVGEFADDGTLLYMCGRADKLRCLRLVESHYVSGEVLADAVRYFPVLEELELSFFWVYHKTIAFVGQNCPSIISFHLNKHGYLGPNSFLAANADINSDQAIAIAKNMPQLQHLELLGNTVMNDGVDVILDCLPLLETLDLRFCWNVEPDDNLMKKLEKIKDLKLPGDSMKGHRHEYEMGVYKGGGLGG